MDLSQIHLPTAVSNELALHADKSPAIIDDEVIRGRLGQRNRDVKPGAVKDATAREVAMSPFLCVVRITQRYRRQQPEPDALRQCTKSSRIQIWCPCNARNG
jgi:hypothetical protein